MTATKRPIIVDLYCGGGGAGYGIFLATGRHADVAVNHSATAVAMYMANSPSTTVIQQDIWSCPPRWACKGRPVALLHASPDCRHFSKAKGAAPNRDEKIRDLPWTIVKWAQEVRPTLITMENVEEIKTWGPLDRNGVPIKARAGETWKRFVHALRREGYKVDWRELRACDYGAPTIRKRLFLIARCDGKRIVWPRPTHGDPKSAAVKSGKLAPWRTAAECIDFSHPCPSIFERKRPLAEATLHRIAEGIERYVVNAAKPFIIGIDNAGARSAKWSVEQPLSTVITKAKHGLVTPYVVNLTHGGRLEDIQAPIKTITAAHRGEKALISPFLAGAGGPVYAGKPVPVDRPMGTLMTTNHEAVISPVLVTNTSGHAPGSVDAPVSTLTTGQHQMLTSAFLAKHYSGVVGQELDKPIGTVTTVDHHSLVALHMQRDFGKSVGHGADEPCGTITAGGGGKSSVVTSHLVKLRGTCKDGQPVDAPAPTITSGGTHVGEVRTACLMKYYGEGGQHSSLSEPLHTIPTKDRMAVVEARQIGGHAAEVRALLVWHRQSKLAWPVGRMDDFDGLLADAFAGEVVLRGELYTIADIGLRMLKPRELFRCQGFPESYIIGDDSAQGLSLTQAEQVQMCGNSVPPDVEAAVVAANIDFGYVLDRGRDLPLLGVL